MAQVTKKTRDTTSPFANQMHQCPEANPGQERLTRDPDDPLGGCLTRPSCPTEVGFGVVNPMTTNREVGRIRTIAICFHHSSIPQVTK